MRTLQLLSLLLLSLVMGCERDDNFPKPTTSSSGGISSLPSASNTVPITATAWHFLVGDIGNRSNPNKYEQSFQTNSAGTTSPIGGTGLVGLPTKTASFTLGMGTSSLIDTASYCYWAYNFNPPSTLRVGSSLTLKAKVRLDQVQGKGISLVLRGDRNIQTSALFATTQGQIPLKGTAPFAEYSITLSYSAAVDHLILYLVMMPKTTGTATFTDVSVAIK